MRGGEGYRAEAATAAAKLYRLRGEPAAAESRFEAALSVGIEGPHLPLTIWASVALVVLYVETGRVAEARPRVDGCLEIVANGEDWRGLSGRVALAEAVVLGAEGHIADAERRFADAVEVFRRYSLPWDEAEGLLFWGRALGKARRRGAAREKLEAAIELYRTRSGGATWTERVAKELRALGPGGAPVPAPYPNNLSAREVEVLRLVAQGRSNREIGASLVLSVRTVERHITNIYAKTDLHTKAQATAFALSHNLS